MTSSRPTEAQEWVTHRIEAWVETYKKAMLTPVLLQLIALHESATVATLIQQVSDSTGWSLTERGLYRTLKRLQDLGLVTSVATSVPRTGAKRKELSLTAEGAALLAGIAAHLITLSDAD